MPSVLVTGAGRGIGRTIAEELATRGWEVIAGVRSSTDVAAVGAAHERITGVLLDVTDEEQLAALDAALPSRLDAVVNNAGIVVAGPMETVTTDGWRKQLDVNVIGQLAVTRAVLPRLRESHGRVVFISSVNGRLSTPLTGAYAASKFALEAAADALRMELAPWRIPVVLVEPAQTDTDMWRTADAMVSEVEADLTPQYRELYARHVAGMRRSVPISQRLAVAPETVADVVYTALTSRRPRPRYVVGLGPKAQVALLTHIPTALRDRLLRVVMRQP
ncbi:SDR family oxidoreductase [Mycolicibacterium fluoranthenivorans]|uniref:NAD(P)-dependent dehydrogenase (Short-subunit alcohol dehydrogenase family) n=1 Tax=Mycolicibacterium fluoranthenivorans TaxID=258505 RepID=A0A7X5R522_9MYCO|nr:SDR family oxidoreductase [Mycolicibacterium fluoranthenivorans]MCV7359422.1 SDR family oxidoreductase [Mycolicibacterium fluoranthenivorans]NIH93489.1 NAD(P)-dependent dehydrogenase (short-subunit alcohol dehydrogenase family) [Mycolicibacterium fluoranthenivorans]